MLDYKKKRFSLGLKLCATPLPIATRSLFLWEINTCSNFSSHLFCPVPPFFFFQLLKFMILCISHFFRVSMPCVPMQFVLAAVKFYLVQELFVFLFYIATSLVFQTETVHSQQTAFTSVGGKHSHLYISLFSANLSLVVTLVLMTYCLYIVCLPV